MRAHTKNLKEKTTQAAKEVKKPGQFGWNNQIASFFFSKVQRFLGRVQASQTDTKQIDADCLPDVLQSLILEYFSDNQSDQKIYRSLGQQGTFFLKKIDVLSQIRAAEKIAHDLLRRIDVEQNLELLVNNPQYLTVKILEVTSRRGQRIQDVTILQVLCMAGACNPRALRSDEENYGLIERVYELFSDREVADQQIKVLQDRGFDAATQKTMAPVKEAINDMIQTIIEAKDLSGEFSALLDRYAPKFKKDLIPDPEYIVNSGFLFDVSIFLYFFNQYEENIEKLGGWNSLKSDLVAAIIYPHLQACTDPGDLELFNAGIDLVLSGASDAPLPSADGMPGNLNKFFENSFFDLFGNQLRTSRLWYDGFPLTYYQPFEAYIKQKHQWRLLCPSAASELKCSMG